MSVANNAMYAGIVDVYGNEIDAGAVGITTLSVGPMVTMAALASAGLANISIWNLVGTVLPLVLGIALGNAFPFMKKACHYYDCWFLLGGQHELRPNS